MRHTRSVVVLAATIAGVALCTQHFMYYMSARSERRKLETAFDRATTITGYIPSARDTHRVTLCDPVALQHVRNLMVLRGGTENPRGLKPTSGGNSIELVIEGKNGVHANVMSTQVDTSRTTEDGAEVHFFWRYDAGNLQKLAKEFGFAWPLMSDVIPIE